MTDLSIMGSKFGRYEIMQRIGRGGMAQVYRAHDTNLDRQVAVKVLHDYLSDDPTFKERFEREAKFVASFNHPNIVQIYDFDSTVRGGEHLYYMVMPYISGNTLKDDLEVFRAKETLMPQDRVLRIAVNLADALDYAHKRGMVHRDIKPANILFDERDQAVLMDFGIARLVVKSNLTREGHTVGTPAYMSPEQATGEAVDARSDIYALGIIIYEMLAGQPPFHDDGTISVLLKHLNEPVPSLSKFVHMPDPSVDAVIFRSLAKHPEDRYQTAVDFIKDLQAALAGQKIQISTASPNNDRKTTLIPPLPIGTAYTEKQDSSTRMTRTIELVAAQVETVARSPLGILVIGLIIIGVMIGINFLNRSGSDAPTSDATSMTGSGKDSESMTVQVTDKFFTTDFSSADTADSIWSTASEDLLTREFLPEGAYRFRNQRMGRAVTSIVENGSIYDDATITLEATLQAESNIVSGYGIVFRYQDEDNYNVFAVDGMGRYSIWLRLNGSWTELRNREDGEQWTRKEAINTAGTSNRLTIDIAGKNLIGYINGKVVTNVKDETFSNGGVGIYLATTAEDNADADLIVTRYSVDDITESMTSLMNGSK
ncbi:MAG: serine/threonine protein kinase [Anaerolineae bacterium]|nr:serine/threonine protein kinase [Anaerolineae bacterium]